MVTEKITENAPSTHCPSSKEVKAQKKKSLFFMKSSYDHRVIGIVALWGTLILCKICLETLQYRDNLQQLLFIKTAFYKPESLAQACGHFSLALAVSPTAFPVFCIWLHQS